MPIFKIRKGYGEKEKLFEIEAKNLAEASRKLDELTKDMDLGEFEGSNEFCDSEEERLRKLAREERERYRRIARGRDDILHEY